MQEIRDKNIERNQAFLQLLGIQPVDIETLKVSEEKKDDISDDYEEPVEYTIKLEDRFPFRNYEIGVLKSFITKPSMSSSVLCFGPAGCGKSSIITVLVSQCRYPAMVFSCDGFRDRKQFLKCFWNDMLKCCRDFLDLHPSLLGTKKKSAMAHHSKIKPPTNFAELFAQLKQFFDGWGRIFNGRRKSMGGIVVFFSKIDAADQLEAGFTERLLSLSEQFRSDFRIIATLRRPPHKAARNCCLLNFTAYDDKQLLKVLEHMARTSINPAFYQASSGGDGIRAGHMPHNDRTQSDEQIFVFVRLIRDSFPRLCTHTKHVGELWQSVVRAWQLLKRRRNSSARPLESGRDIIVTAPFSDNQGERGGYSDSVAVHGDDSKSVATEWTHNALDATVQHILHLPLTSTTAASAQLDSLGGKRKHLAAPSYLSHVDTREWLAPITDLMDLDSLRSHEWRLNLPMSQKYLLIAAFLAASNPKESDEHTFGDGKRGKRKKQRASRASAVQSSSSSLQGGLDGKASNTVASNKASHSATAPRIFTLERLFTIFAQIACVGGIDQLGGGQRAALALGRPLGLVDVTAAAEEIARCYGDAQLFATVTAMVEQRLLVAGATWSLGDPSYQCGIDEITAQKIATSLGFPLQDFMYRGSTQSSDG